MIRKINSNLSVDEPIDQLLTSMPETAKNYNYANSLRHLRVEDHQGYQPLSKLKSCSPKSRLVVDFSEEQLVTSPRAEDSKFSYFAGAGDQSQRSLNRYNLGNRQNRHVKLEEFITQSSK